MAKKKVNKGQKVSSECLQAASKALNLFSSDELKEYTIQVFKRSREYEELGSQAAIERAVQDVNKSQMDILLNQATIKANNTFKFEKAASLMKKGVNLSSFVHRTKVNKDYNIETSQKAAQSELYRNVFSKMSKEQEAMLVSGKHDEDLLSAMDGVKHSNPEINAIAKILKDYPELIRNPEIVKSNALPAEYINPDRMLRNYHNASLVASGGQSLITRAKNRFKVDVDSSKNVWREDIKRELDLEKTFGDTTAANLDGTLNMREVDKIIDGTFDNIVQDRSAIFTRSVVANDREALAKKRRMFYHFKDWRSWGRYNKKYGKGTLHQALMADIQTSGNQVGMARLFGDSPASMWNDLRHLQDKERPLTTTQHRYADNLFKQVSGLDKTSSSPTIANIGGSLTSWSSMSRLGSLVINSLADISQVGGIAQRFGYGYWKPYVDGIIHAFNLMPSETRSIVAKSMKMNLDVHMGYTGRFADATDLGQMFSKVSNTFYWSNLTMAWDKGNKLSAMTPIAEGLGRDSSKAFSELHPQTRSQLEKFNIAPHEWDALRAKTSPQNKNLFLTDNVDAMTDKEMRALWEQGDKLTPYSDYRSHLYRKVYAMFDTLAENAVLDPRAFERLVTTANIPPGTPLGMALRMVMQFKSYPIATARRVWYGGMADFDSAQAKFMYALNMSAGNFALGYLSLTLSSLAKGLTPPDPSKMSYNEKVKFYTALLAPGLGTFLKVLDPHNQNNEMAINLLLTPSVRLFTDPLAAGFAVATGNPKGAVRNVKDFAKYANPIGTVPFAEPFFDSMMGKKPYVEPGQKPIF